MLTRWLLLSASLGGCLACDSSAGVPGDPQDFIGECTLVCDRYGECGVDPTTVQACRTSCLAATFIQDAETCGALFGQAQACANQANQDAPSMCDDQLATACGNLVSDALEGCAADLPDECVECNACPINLRNRCRVESGACAEGGPGIPGQISDCCAAAFAVADCS
ncbi:MAG: hypothetical protein AAGD10_06620 [Myxococcota bacterium]